MTPKTAVAMLKRGVSQLKPPPPRTNTRDASTESERGSTSEGPTSEGATSEGAASEDATSEEATWEAEPDSVTLTPTAAPLPGGPNDAVRHYDTLSKLHKQLAEVENVLANERRERDTEADRMRKTVAQLAEQKGRAEAAEKRAETASARVATLESELATTQIVTAALDEQLIATEEALARAAHRPSGGSSDESVEEMRERIEALTTTLDRMKELVGNVRSK
jgi:hypothetical protein